MEQQFDFEVQVKLKRKNRRKTWQRILGAMMCVVVFCTTYMLILPAITKETEVFCGLEEHAHGETCYEKVLLCESHVHTQECYASHSELVCTEPTDDGHTHGEACSPITETTLVCGQEETPGHTHGEACSAVTETSLTCALAESEGHTHTESCSSTETVLSCLEDHAHGDACYTTVTTIICGIEESSGHAHSDGCYTTTTTYGCGMEETQGHTHTDACYTAVTTYSCGLEESAPSHVHTDACYETIQQNCLVETAQDHEHTDDCYSKTLICTHKEHTHTTICFSDSSADLESASTWEATLPQLSGEYAADVLAIAKSQLGYRESTRNYIVTEDNEMKGYTRYGAWYGIPYGDWCAMFVSFCLDYAGVEDFPQDSNCPNWVNTLKERNLYAEAEGYVPNAGDLIFFDWDDDGRSDHVGLVAEYIPATDSSAAQINTIEGNSGNAVRRNTYNLVDATILGYGQLPFLRVGAPNIVEELPVATVEDSQSAVANVIEQAETEAATFSVLRRSGMMMAASPATSTRSTAVTGTTDMTNLIDAVTVYKKQNGAWVKVESGGTITQGEDLKFTIDYTVDGMVLSDSVNTLVYKIPSNITHVVSSSGLVYNDAKEAVGTFTIDAEENIITITFSDDYVDNNQLNKAIEGAISFYATVERITQEGDETTDIIFSDEVKIEMEVEEKEDVIGDVSVNKSITQVKGTEITYEVVVSSETGTFSAVTLTDELTGGLQVQATTLQIMDKSGKPVSYSVDPASTTANFTLTLPQMVAGDTYTITYTANLAGSVEGHAIANNKAIVNTTNNQNIPISDFAEVDHTFNALNKTGKLQEDGSIQWTIVINEDKMDLSGAILRDIMQDTDGTQADYTGPVTITDSKGNAYQITLPFQFPEGASDTYTITYTTTHAQVSGANDVLNWVGLGFNDKGVIFEDLDGVGIGTNYPVTKQGELLSVDYQTGEFLIKWTVTLDTSNGLLPAGSYIQDKLDNDQFMTFDQMKQMIENVLEAIEPYDLTIKNVIGIDRDTGSRIYYDEMMQAGDSKTYKQFYVQFTEVIPEGIRFTFSFEATADTAPNRGYFQNRISINDTAEYTAKVEYVSNVPTISKYGVSPNNGFSVHPNDTDVNYDDLYELEGHKTIWWRLRLNVPEGYNEAIVVTDTLPEGMVLVGTIAQPWGSTEQQQTVYPDENGYALFNWSNYYYLDMQVTEGTDGNQTVTYTLRQETAQVLSTGNIDLYVVCTFRDDFNWGETDAVVVQVPFTNAVKAESPDGDKFDTDDHTFTVSYDKSDEVVSKSGALTELNELEYAVVLNEKGRDLDPDESTLKVQDVLTYVSPAQWPIKLYLKPGSVNVYDYTGGVKGALITTARYTYTEGSAGEGDITYTHTLDLVLPDAQAILLEYVYTVDGVYNENYSYDMINTCTITGIANGSIQDDVQIDVKVYDASAEANFNGIYIYKVDAYNNKLYLPGAVFNLYTWNNQTKEYVRVKHPNTSGRREAHYAFTTDEDGFLILNGDTMEAVAFNTAYYITEVTAPSGYFKDPDPYYFYIEHGDTNQNPYNFPEGFNGDRLNSGALIYYYNEPATTEIVIHKKWQDHNANPITVTADQVESVSFELWQKLDGVENSDTLYGTYTVTPDANGFWEVIITDLPKCIVNPEDGTKGTLYLYYIKEVTALDYEVSYGYDDENDASIDDSGGINNGTITMTNRQKTGYELPETGGTGTHLYTTAGLLLTLTGTASLLYMHKKRRREEQNTS